MLNSIDMPVFISEPYNAFTSVSKILPLESSYITIYLVKFMFFFFARFLKWGHVVYLIAIVLNMEKLGGINIFP